MDVEILPNGEKDKYLLSDIPKETWNSFVERAKQLRPDIENPALAWAALLGDFMDSLANVDKKVIILRDIPTREYEAFATHVAQARTDISSFLSELIMSASVGKFYLARYARVEMKDDKKSTIRGRHCLVVSGLTDMAMLPFERLFKVSRMPIATQFAQMFAHIEQGKVEMQMWKKDEDGIKQPFVSFEEAAKNAEASSE